MAQTEAEEDFDLDQAEEAAFEDLPEWYESYPDDNYYINLED